MATALDVIKRSLRLLGVYAIGETPSADEGQDGLTALNALVGSLSNSSGLIHARTVDSIPVSAGTASVTVGPSGVFVTTRPVNVLDDSYVDIAGVSYPLSLLAQSEYSDIASKALQGIPRGLWVDAKMPNITVTMYPVPDQALTLKLVSGKLISSFPALTTAVSLPDGYERMLAYLLAIEIAPEYERDAPLSVVRIAADARRVIKRTNLEIPSLDMPHGVPYRRGSVDIREL